jgi:hypothetical protein
MAGTVRKRIWTTRKGEEKSAWSPTTSIKSASVTTRAFALRERPRPGCCRRAAKFATARTPPRRAALRWRRRQIAGSIERRMWLR